MKKVSIRAAKSRLSALVEAALAGEDVVIVRGTQPVVRLVPITGRPFKIGLLDGQLGRGPDFFAPLPDDELDRWEGGP